MGVGVGSGEGVGTTGKAPSCSASGVGEGEGTGVGVATACIGGGGVTMLATWLGGGSGEGRSAAAPIAATARRNRPARIRTAPNGESHPVGGRTSAHGMDARAARPKRRAGTAERHLRRWPGTASTRSDDPLFDARRLIIPRGTPLHRTRAKYSGSRLEIGSRRSALAGRTAFPQMCLFAWRVTLSCSEGRRGDLLPLPGTCLNTRTAVLRIILPLAQAPNGRHTRDRS